MTVVAHLGRLPLALLLSSSLAIAADKPFVARDLIGDGAFTHNAEGPATGPDGALYAVNLGKDGTIARIALQADGSARAEVFVTLPEGSTGNGIRFATAPCMSPITPATRSCRSTCRRAR